MSQTSFPRSEHTALLLRKIEERIGLRGLPIEVAERGLNQLKCQYRFGLRSGSEGEWRELAIHFQYAARFESDGGDDELNRIVDRFLDQFPNRHVGPSQG